MSKVIKVLVVDDSAYVRKVVREMLSQSPFIEVVGTARDGSEALDLVETLQPDVVTTDLIMPVLDGTGFVREQMSRRAIPIVMMSSMDEDSSDTLSALDAGAVDFVQKPTALAVEKMFEMRDQLIEKVRIAATAHPMRHAANLGAEALVSHAAKPRGLGARGVDIVVLGISTGGPQALRYLIPQLPKEFPVPIAIVLHMPVGYTATYAERLNEISALEVSEAQNGDELLPGRVLIGQAGKHLMFRRRGRDTVVATLGTQPIDSPYKPSVDVLFQSAAETFGNRTLGVVMTGMGSDGRAGAAWIKAQGGRIFTEAEESCVVYGMPNCVVEAGLSDKVVPLEKMGTTLIEAT
jgi:two-component system chemotaxis response regulator CheB